MNNLRPTDLSGILGQTQVIEALRISIASAQERNCCLSHTLFYGPPGTGKTTLANAISHEMGCSLQIANGANLRSIRNIIPYVMRIKDKAILFIDEIHRMTNIVEEFLYPVMEDFKVDMAVPTKDLEGEVISIELAPFTLIGATTEFGALSKPLIDRFKHKHILKLYNTVELQAIVDTNVGKLNLNISPEGSCFITKISRGTPRIANAHLEWLRDYQIAKGIQRLSESDVEAAMTIQGIDSEGFTEMDRKYLKTLKNIGQPLGINSLVSMTGIDRETIEGIIEPWLLQNHRIIKTSKGRVLS